MTNRERLERVKRFNKHIDDFREIGNERMANQLLERLFNELHIDWLIEQAERVEDLEEANKRYRDALLEIRKRPTFMTHEMHSNRSLKIAEKAVRR